MGKSSGSVRIGGGLNNDREVIPKAAVAKRLGGAESLNNIKDKRLLKAVQNGIQKYYSKLGAVSGERDVQLESIKGAAGVQVTAGGKSVAVRLATQYFKNETFNNVVKRERSGYDAKFITRTNAPAQHTIVHEMGHSLWNASLSSAKAVSASKDIGKKFKEFKADRAFRDKNGYGSYALSNVSEFWAEVTAKAVLGTPDKYTKWLKTTVKKYKL